MTDATLHETPVVPPTGARPTTSATAGGPIGEAGRNTARTASARAASDGLS